MVKKIITFVDLQGRYRVTSPAYNDATNSGLTETELINKVIREPVKGLIARYGLSSNHVFHIVEDADQRACVAECCGTYFRYGAIMLPNREGVRDNTGEIVLCRDARDGAWEMNTDGTPKVNMTKARGVHMDCIRACRNTELVKLDLTSLRAIEAGDTSAQSTVATKKQVLRDIPATFDITTGITTPELLKAKWPAELPARE